MHNGSYAHMEKEVIHAQKRGPPINEHGRHPHVYTRQPANTRYGSHGDHADIDTTTITDGHSNRPHMNKGANQRTYTVTTHAHRNHANGHDNVTQTCMLRCLMSITVAHLMTHGINDCGDNEGVYKGGGDC